MSSSSRKEHRHSSSSHRREESPRRRSRRSESPDSKRDERELPPNFGPSAERRDVEDNLNVLQRMANITGPLELLSDSIATGKELKIWTRNYKEIRGICTGQLLAFDKHWNLVLKGVEEVFLKKKKSKTPFLRELNRGEDIADLPPRVPRTKASATANTEKTSPAEKESTPAAPNGGSGEEKKKRRKKTKKSAKPEDRRYEMVFVRGDNIVMIAYKEKEKEKEKNKGKDKDC